MSGNPYSPERLIGLDLTAKDPWGGQLPAFLSLDVRIDRQWHRRWGDINLYFDVHNVLNRRNVEGRKFDWQVLREVDIRGLPIIPFIGVEFLPLR